MYKLIIKNKVSFDTYSKEETEALKDYMEQLLCIEVHVIPIVENGTVNEKETSFGLFQ